MSACFFGLQIVGLLLLRDPTSGEEQEISRLNSDNGQGKEREDCVTANCPPRRAVKQFDFWMLYISFTALSATSTFVSNYQKAFAQKYIRDDQYLAGVGTALNVANGVSRIIGGLAYDAFGFKVGKCQQATAFISLTLLQDCVFVLTGLVAILAFSLGDLSAMEENSAAATIFYTFVIIGMFSCLPGEETLYSLHMFVH